MPTEKRWATICSAAKWAGIDTSPEEQVKLKAVQIIQKAVRKKLPSTLSAQEKKPLSFLPSVDLNKSGICLVDFDEAAKWALKTLPIVPDPLAIIMIHADETFEGLPRPEFVSFPALDMKGRRVILKGAVWQLGERHVKIEAVKHELTLPETIVIAATVWRDESSTELWSACMTNLVRATLDPLELPDRSIILEVWGRSYRNSQGKSEPSSAASAQFHFRVHRSKADCLLKESGKSSIYLTPKSENKRSHEDWNMIWFRDKTEASIAMTRATQHAGMARSKDKWAVRIPQHQFDHVFQELKPGDDPKLNVLVKKLFKIQPVPPGFTQEHVLQWTSKINWKTKVLKKLGKDAFLLGAESDPPHENIYLNNTLMLIKPVGNENRDKIKTTPLVAGPKQPAGKKRQDTVKEGDDPFIDPWAPWAANRARVGSQSGSSGVANSSVSAGQAPTQPAMDPPIAAKFAAFEKRLTDFEHTMSTMDSNQKMCAQQVEQCGQRLQSVETNIESVQQQIQGGIERAFAKSMKEQSKQLDMKFSQLAQLLQGNAAPKRPLPEDEDHQMESPTKDRDL
eukprot:Skav228108  [mRNA]  locus=scaffold730:184193:185890:+ [translate_table: standard]